MPDRTKLKIGDRIRLLRVPAGESSRWTKVTIEAIIRQDPVVTIDRIDEYGQPWFNYNLARPNGRVAEHTLAVMEDDSWVPARRGKRTRKTGQDAENGSSAICRLGR